jgi:hypothetical protein
VSFSGLGKLADWGIPSAISPIPVFIAPEAESFAEAGASEIEAEVPGLELWDPPVTTTKGTTKHTTKERLMDIIAILDFNVEFKATVQLPGR